MKEIPLTKGQVTIVDDADFDFLNQWKWFTHISGNVYYARRNIKVGNKKTLIDMHRVIMQTPKGMDTDHINHNGLDNRRDNLRNCTHKDNHANRLKCTTRKSSTYLGVSKRRNGWRAYYTLNGKYIYIGDFSTEIEAAIAHNKAREQYYGKLASFNDIGKGV